MTKAATAPNRAEMVIGALLARVLLSEKVAPAIFQAVPPRFIAALSEKYQAAFVAIMEDVKTHGEANIKRILEGLNGTGPPILDLMSSLLEADTPPLPKILKDLHMLPGYKEAARAMVLEEIQPRKALDLLSEAIPEPVAIVEKILYAATVLMIAGPPKVGKTWLALQLALALVAGKPLLGFEVPERKRVLYLGGEGDDSHLKKRLLAAIPYIEELDEEHLKNLLVLSTLGRVKADDPAGAEAIERCAESADVLILDPIFRFQGKGSENDHADARALHDFLDRFKLQGKAVVLVHHQRKPGTLDAGISEISGAGWDRYIDGALRIQRKREEYGDRFLLKFDLRHDEAPEDMELVREGPLFTPADVGKRIVMPNDVVEVLREAGGRIEGRQSFVEALARRTGCKATSSTPKDAILDAEKDGLILSVKRAGTRGQGRVYILKENPK